MLLLALGCGSPCGQERCVADDTDAPFTAPIPDIFVVQEAVDFGTLPETGEGHRPLTIENRGDGRLNVFAITVRDSVSVVVDSDDDFFLEAGEALDLDLVWTPADATPMSAIIEVKSNDPDERVVEIPTEGVVAD